ncbi:unnamed protein product [Penicillium salamii]|uniref:DUF7703 domain-containing protein n=1 Tax=Penicillium salamii TaxID=1612424 RepID=A0A9W4J590_9EURO|nr:unnamed protein product [Penicillium salamii]CAG8082845.1 unnamed protein product [Penicillium salamii]CAG8137204.1 unnamed protein product [Penicillium salamii]CAG8180139.1 unnamed protein product [Penicillium salamii]CAG8271458.1 unnamed protein product [Penicillium salamii]
MSLWDGGPISSSRSPASGKPPRSPILIPLEPPIAVNRYPSTHGERPEATIFGFPPLRFYLLLLNLHFRPQLLSFFSIPEPPNFEPFFQSSLSLHVHSLGLDGNVPMSSADLTGRTFSLADRDSDGRFAERTIVACLIGIAWYNALELIVLCFTTFKRYGGCYFWCLLIASFSIIPFGLGYLLIIYNIYTNLFPVAMELVAWVGMVTGQSLVLWSRLHLVCHNPSVLRATLAMIIIDAIIFHIPGSVLELGSHATKSTIFDTGFNIFERIQLVGFSIQEIILSVIYAWEGVRLLNLRPRGHYRGTLVQLLIVNIAMILMDAAVIGVQYSGLFDIHVTLKALVYSIKLKLEYAILGKLVDITEIGGSSTDPTDLSDFVDLSFHNNGTPQPDIDEARFADNLENGTRTRVRVSSKGSSTNPLTRTLSAAQTPSLTNSDV